MISLRKITDSRTWKFIGCFNIWSFFLHTRKTITVCVLHLLCFNIGSSHWSIVYHRWIFMSFCLLNELIKLIFDCFASKLRNMIWLIDDIRLDNVEIWRFRCFVILTFWNFILIGFRFGFRILLFSGEDIHHRCYRRMLSISFHGSSC